MAIRPFMLAFLTMMAGCAFEAASTSSGNGELDGRSTNGPGGAAGAAFGGSENAGGVGGAGDVGGVDGSGGVDGLGGVEGLDAGRVDGLAALASCTPGTERTDCPGTSCDPATLRCSTFPLASRPACWTCVSDTDCESPDHRCVEMYFQGRRFPDEKRGFCLKVASVEVEFDDGTYVVDDPLESNCPRPYTTILVRRPSLSGAPTRSYCGLREDLTTCFAVRAFQNQEECPSGRDDECPNGGVCRTFDDKRNGAIHCCTYACTADRHCPIADGSTTSCGGYCGG